MPRQQPPATLLPLPSDPADALALLPAMDAPALRAHWTALVGTPAPRVRPQLLRLALAHELQLAACGPLPSHLERRLAALAGGATAASLPRPGMRLVREWNGALHTVTIDDGGAPVWQGRTYRSLSEVARAITGSRWSGPVFFGLRKQKRAA
ncbi:hypothetical protein GCM10011371_34840 [Novosphingobium marinum]|uniref:DUF2924 domain-containing protein n=1 Tax=Novosphingobium marinum TaxID=1514948 RepID=A0A7Y9Y1U5_9SPHN|nr:DUF2924 domain-containing protein [Novosphingobium marinum]NYH97183.1 hypothetical protein [Novosphingobium marinum]GGC44438.1 hypothetical protein GCM10011371_34840 [Novosphingobium marinum]